MGVCLLNRFLRAKELFFGSSLCPIPLPLGKGGLFFLVLGARSAPTPLPYETLPQRKRGASSRNLNSILYPCLLMKGDRGDQALKVGPWQGKAEGSFFPTLAESQGNAK